MKNPSEGPTMNPESHYPKASTSASGIAPEERPGQPDPGDEEEQSHGLARKVAEIERKVADGN